MSHRGSFWKKGDRNWAKNEKIIKGVSWKQEKARERTGSISTGTQIAEGKDNAFIPLPCRSFVRKKEIQKQIDDGIDYEAGQITVIELLEKYISLKKGVRYNT